jgi:tetratricopeptide (TPR) repeat protein
MTPFVTVLSWLVTLAFLSPAPPAAPSDAQLSSLQTARNVGLAALEEGNLGEAKKRFEEVRRLAPAEPLGWADGGVAALREKDLVTAEKLLAEAGRLAPSDPRVAALRGALAEQAGQADAAIAFFEKAAAGDPRDLASRWSAARLLAEKPGGRPRAIRQVQEALEQAPANLFLLLRLSELERIEGDRAGAEAALDRALAEAAGSMPGDGKLERFAAEAKAGLQSGDMAGAALKARVVENLLRATSRYQQARHEVEPGVVGLPLEDWTPALSERLRARPAAIPVRFVERREEGLAALSGLSAVRAAGADGRDLAFAGASGIVLARAKDGFRAGAPLSGSGATATLEVADIDNTGELDVAAPGGLFLAQGDGFVRTAIPAGASALPIDFDSDGDLDLYISSPAGDKLLRNNLDGTWTDVTAAALPEKTDSRFAVAADFDRDGDPDLVLARAGGGLTLLDNRRGGRFAQRDAGLPGSGVVTGLSAGDLNADGRPDLVWSGETAASVALNRGDGTLGAATALPSGGTPLLFDFDNDGALDLLLTGAKGSATSALYRNDGAGVFAPADQKLPPAGAAEALDVDGDGDLDLVLVTRAGTAELYANEGGNANGWMDVALEGLPTGSAKVNRLGYGSEIEARAGQLYVFRTAGRPVTHLGLGPRRRADVLRIVWTNGVPQNALDPPARTVLREVQQLKGSCPFLYAFDGNRWHFVTDALGRSPAGLLYDGIHQAAADTREWLVVPGTRLAPAEGKLLLDFTEELWESVYFDLAELAAVDHPAGIEIVANERMVPPPFPEKRLYTVSRPLTPRATDGSGRDRTEEIAREDGVFLGGLTPTRYQGIVAPHTLVLELPRARDARRVMLYLTGWIFYSDTSINVSLSQGAKTERAAPPVLEVPDGKGGWKTALPAMGYPAGKTKTMPIDLSGVLDRADPRVRIRTNLEIYWDRIAYTVDEEEAPLEVTPIPLSSARLFVRGFSRGVRETPDGPHVFLHDEVDTAPRWADMAGLYTRLGDVRDLLLAADDRYVVMKGGDCVRLEFDARAIPPPRPGWERDYILRLDGWDKDADKNTVAGQTVEPFPFHGQDDARYGSEQPFPGGDAGKAWREQTLTRRGGPEDFVDAVLRAPAPSGLPRE